METLTFLRRFSERTEAQRYIRDLEFIAHLGPPSLATYRVLSSASGHRVYRVTTSSEQENEHV